MFDKPTFNETDANLSVSPAATAVAAHPKKESNGGENPYMFVANQLGIAEKVEEQIKIYASSNRTEADYQALIDWEVENFTIAYKALFGTEPKEGDLEKMLPASEATVAAKATLPKLNLKGVGAAVVSSGFSYLVDPAVAELGIHPENAFANRFTYDEQSGHMNGVEVTVSGNKVGALKKAITSFQQQGISANEIAYVGDNNWDLDAMRYILAQGGHVYYLQPGGDENAKMYPLTDPTLFDHDRFHVIDNLTDLLAQPDIGNKIKAIIYDADGTIIDTK